MVLLRVCILVAVLLHPTLFLPRFCSCPHPALVLPPPCSAPALLLLLPSCPAPSRMPWPIAMARVVVDIFPQKHSTYKVKWGQMPIISPELSFAFFRGDIESNNESIQKWKSGCPSWKNAPLTPKKSKLCFWGQMTIFSAERSIYFFRGDDKSVRQSIQRKKKGIVNQKMTIWTLKHLKKAILHFERLDVDLLMAIFYPGKRCVFAC